VGLWFHVWFREGLFASGPPGGREVTDGTSGPAAAAGSCVERINLKRSATTVDESQPGGAS
jgi:hypothetical protein